LRRMVAADPVERPSAPEALAHLDALLAPAGATAHRSAGTTAVSAATVVPLAPAPERLGRFRLREVLGEGGLGRVFRAEGAGPWRSRWRWPSRPTWPEPSPTPTAWASSTATSSRTTSYFRFQI